MKSNEPLYPIREVSRLTGVNAITLRAWERRYALIEPVRTDSGHRLYTQAHIERIKSAVKLTEQGIPISRVKGLLDETLASDSVTVSADDSDYPALLLQKARNYDLPGLHQALDFLLTDLPDDQVLQVVHLVSSELQAESKELGRLWSAVVLPRLYTRLRFLIRGHNLLTTKRLWVQSGSTQTTEVSLLLVAIWFASQGVYPIMQIDSQEGVQISFDALKKLHCEGLVVVDDCGAFDEESWWVWIQKHPTLEFHYVTKEAKSTLLGNQLQAEHHDLETLF